MSASVPLAPIAGSTFSTYSFVLAPPFFPKSSPVLRLPRKGVGPPPVSLTIIDSGWGSKQRVGFFLGSQHTPQWDNKKRLCNVCCV